MLMEDRIRAWDDRMRQTDLRIRPIATCPVGLGALHWLWKLVAGSHPLDEAGVRNEAETLLIEIVDAYATASSEERTAIRKMFKRQESFAWAAALPHPAKTPAEARRHLLHFSILDLGRDSRDAIVWLADICDAAVKAGVDLAPILREVAELSSAHDAHGMGSARQILQNRAAVLSERRGASLPGRTS
jgi:hypothetical protein